MASKFSRREELRQVADQIERAGAVITSRWLRNEQPLANDELRGDGPAAAYAAMDLEDLRGSDMCIAFTEPGDSSASGRGGRHAELGIAIGLELDVVVIGPREHVFHCLPEISQYASWAEAWTQLLPERRVKHVAA